VHIEQVSDPNLGILAYVTFDWALAVQAWNLSGTAGLRPGLVGEAV
jgi:hypothetical protein